MDASTSTSRLRTSHFGTYTPSGPLSAGAAGGQVGSRFTAFCSGKRELRPPRVPRPLNTVTPTPALQVSVAYCVVYLCTATWEMRRGLPSGAASGLPTPRHASHDKGDPKTRRDSRLIIVP
ncbi:hypothetical protein CABS01_14962 [Colletotrichum abscissum]|uniref:Uncharacterized protein n=2 Tax=Colletotrichum acutatum species complex TaxID=2707335 RepID=A0A9P9X9W4_9PEZI|nr:uncharacterized protein CCOS01_04658 [Colletotrichum costaricense]XP_060392296.1 uncharacterized protein CABS01_14962 [Colletotrichum abscissum]KAI3543442.1 hypothetical protein CABS02_10045 [Colletotrichum abscissum]KAK1477495.1 hypothetical protein CABS01_14962 [Colletotrichum abscissum]KAK1532675.1 hypothetical protein CCOS01_04658 [Colletotrichum costaricense]